MKCPKCNNEVQQHPTSVLYGIRKNQIEVLAAGDFSIAFCCGVAIITEKPTEQPLIITQPQELVTSICQNNITDPSYQ